MIVGEKPKSSDSKFRQLLDWCSDNRPQVLAGVGGLLIIIAAGATYYVLTRPLPAVNTGAIATKPRPPKPKYYSPIDGSLMQNEADGTKPVTAIMIENSPDARPQSGIKDAQVVYEAIAEGGITRFVAIYQQNKPQLVGPVRSIRPYYLDWAAPYDAAIAHVGGSAEALQQVRSGAFRDIDQFFNGNSYWRVNDRAAPHNVYTSFEKLDALQASKGYTSSAPKGILRAETKPAAQPNATHIDVGISGPMYNSSYDYDVATNGYKRSQNGAPHTDREKGQITPKVIIVMKAPMFIAQQQDTWRGVIDTTAGGEAKIFQDGTVIEATWSKTAREEQLSFVDANAKPIALARGQTWVTIVPASTGSVAWK
jgi:hypothetical protein